jgi:serine/threonine protein kinase
MYESSLGEKYSYIVMELCDSDLRQKLTSNQAKLPENEAIQIYIQIIKGFRFLVNLGYIHRDVK